MNPIDTDGYTQDPAVRLRRIDERIEQKLEQVARLRVARAKALEELDAAALGEQLTPPGLGVGA